MKKNLLKFSVTLFIIVIAFSGCKKGEDDPFISFRSRDSRIIGVWALQSSTYTETNQTVTKRSNNVNTDNSNSDEKTTTTKIFDGTTYIYKNEDDDTYKGQTTSYDYTTDSFVTYNSNTNEKSLTTQIFTYSVKVEIKKDHTYEATYTKTQVERKTTYSTTDDGVTTTTATDTVYSPQNTKTWTEKGNWYWGDANDDKVYISAGPLSGVLKQLKNKEIVIETINNSTNNNTEYTKQDLKTNDDTSDANKTEQGIVTETTTTTYSSSDSQTWETSE